MNKHALQYFRDAVALPSLPNEAVGYVDIGARLAYVLGEENKFSMQGIKAWADALGCTVPHVHAIVQDAYYALGGNKHVSNVLGYPDLGISLYRIADKIREVDDLPKLSDRNFSGCNFSSCELYYNDFKRSSLVSTWFHSTTLHGCDFTKADVSRAIFSKAVIVYSDFTEATAMFTSFNSADIRYSNFYNADVLGAEFIVADVRHTDMRSHRLPSENLIKAATLKGSKVLYDKNNSDTVSMRLFELEAI